MWNSFIGIPTRIAFFLCGLISLVLGRVFRALVNFNPVGPDRASHASWSVFSVILIVVGVLAFLAALLPGSWIKKALKVESTGHSLIPIKMMGAFAGASYFGIAGLSIASYSWRPSPDVVLAICPACAVTITVDPSLATILLFLAPLSAAVYGAFGGELGYLSVLLQRQD